MNKTMQPPQGIEDRHADSRRWHRHANPVALLALAALMATALSGFLAGYPHPHRSLDTPQAKAMFELPERLRNGEFFEMRISVTAKQPIDDLTLAISSTYWREMTINSMIPAPADEKSDAGAYRFSYGPLKPGETRVIKFDGQINPPLFAGTGGSIVLADGEREMGRLPVTLKVLP